MLSRRLLVHHALLTRPLQNLTPSTCSSGCQMSLAASLRSLPRPRLVSHRPVGSLTWTATSNFRSIRHSSSDSSSSDNSPAVEDVSKLVQSHRIVLFMKGNPGQPQCGFSNVVCRLLEMHGVLEKASQDKEGKLFASYDVLQDQGLRSAAKLYSDWPTFPQVFLDGQFIGGCDILLDMHKSGQLAEELERSGIGSVLLQTPVSDDDGSKR